MLKNFLFFSTVAVVFFLWFCPVAAAQDSLLYPSLPVGMKAPDIKGKDENGKSFKLSEIKSRFVLLYFYEVHCHLCATVTPELKKLFDAYNKTGLEVVAVAVESGKEDWLEYLREHKPGWRNVLPAGKCIDKLRSDYKLTVSPTFYLLDKNKILLTQRIGRIERVEEELNQRIR